MKYLIVIIATYMYIRTNDNKKIHVIKVFDCDYGHIYTYK